MTDAGIVLHAGTHAGIWGVVEVAVAVAVLAVSVALVAALLRKGRDGGPETGLAAAGSALEGRTDGSTSEDGGRPFSNRDG